MSEKQKLIDCLGACSEPVIAVALFADLSGFTQLVGRASTQGPAGIERFSRGMSRLCGDMIDVVIEHGGDVEKSVGDAIVAFWIAKDANALETATRLALQCSPWGFRLCLR